MNYELILVRYGEIALKSKETRKRFENVLVSNIKNAFSLENISNNISKEWGRIYIYTNQIEKSISVLQKIFGIISISPALQTTSNIDSISDLAINISKENLGEKKSFALRVTRTGEHKFTSQDVAIKIGNDIVKATKANVDLSKPDFELFIEIRNDKAFLFTKKIRGTGGMPFGTQGNVLSLIDSPKSILAAWFLMRRGCKTVFVITDKSSHSILETFMKKWYVKSDVISLKSDKELFNKLGQIAHEKNCSAIVTSHTLQNYKRTLSDIAQLKKHLNLSLLFPLIAMTKKEIDKKCEEIGLAL